MVMTVRARRVGAAVALVGAGLSLLPTISCTETGRILPVDTAASASASASATRVDLTGAGATFPYPLYARWFNDYATRTNVRINYQSIGSGGGIRQMLAGTVDFGASDVPVTDEEMREAKSPIIHIPTVLGAVAVTYNLPSIGRPLKLSGAVVADIFLGRITRWDDSHIASLNPGATLPAADILVVHRADGSGTSYIMSDYLTAVSPAWSAGPGRGKDVRWPTGIGGRGNEGVAGQVKGMVGAIGYLEVVYARQNHLPVAHLRNAAGRFVAPMPFEIAAAATAVASDDLRTSIVNAPGDHSYPLASFTWILVSPASLGATKTRQLADMLRWALVDGAEIASGLGYVPLPMETATRVLERLERIAPRAKATDSRTP